MEGDDIPGGNIQLQSSFDKKNRNKLSFTTRNQSQELVFPFKADVSDIVEDFKPISMNVGSLNARSKGRLGGRLSGHFSGRMSGAFNVHDHS